jgi:hypothetical protein
MREDWRLLNGRRNERRRNEKLKILGVWVSFV